MTSADSRARRALSVSNSGSPGPAPARVTEPGLGGIMCKVSGFGDV